MVFTPPLSLRRLVLESVIFQELFDKLELSNFEIASGELLPSVNP